MKDGKDSSSIVLPTEPESPIDRRYITHDTTYEKLGEILAQNPQGIMAVRDELVSLLKTLDREEYASARGFFLTAWNGTESYTFDRILRGKTHIEAACLSLLGSTQPGRIAEYINRAVRGGAGDDGLIQRFNLLAWPDQSPEWKEVDRTPLILARDAAWKVFEGFEGLQGRHVSATIPLNGSTPFLRFDDQAQGLFGEWRPDFEAKIRSGELHPALESHLAKYRKLVPTIALINHLADGGVGSVSEAALRRALKLALYCETHARRTYAAGTQAAVDAAQAILKHIRKCDLADGFTARDLHQKDWSRLTDRDAVEAGLTMLVDYDWLAEQRRQTHGRGRPTTTYAINPRTWDENAPYSCHPQNPQNLYP
jgi:putative DNA primase/helicase